MSGRRVITIDEALDGGYRIDRHVAGAPLAYKGPRFDPDESAEVCCPDLGACHHQCLESCYRVCTGEPLPGAYPGDEWPFEIKRRHEPPPPIPESEAWWTSRQPESESRTVPITTTYTAIFDRQPRLWELERFIDQAVEDGVDPDAVVTCNAHSNPRDGTRVSLSVAKEGDDS